MLYDELPVSMLAAANQANRFAYVVYLGRSACADYHYGPSITWVLRNLPPLNRVYVDHLTPDTGDRVIADALAYFRSKHLSATSWWPRPGVDAAELGRQLEAYGMAYDDSMPGMAADLSTLPQPSARPPDLIIEPVSDENTLRRWVHAGGEGFEAPAETEAGVYEFFQGLGFDLPLRSYLGSLNGDPVAISQLFLGVDVAGIYSVATAPRARRQGIGTSMTLAAMQEARALGYRTVVLQASPIGLPVYERLGFRRVCRMKHWEWHDTPHQGRYHW